MGLIAKDLPTLVFMLLPGFLAAGIFYTLTAHPKSSEFERLIQALIFTAILRALTVAIHGFASLLGQVRVLGQWTENVDLVWSVVLSMPVGLTFAYLANLDRFHGYLRRKGLTTKTSFPSEWYGTFVLYRRWVVLDLVDGRRLFGWPIEWPDQPDKGHFVLHDAEWLLDNNERAPLYRVAALMIPASDVKMVEFLKADDEGTEDPAEIDRVERLLIDAQKESHDGSEGTAAGPQSPPESGGED